LFSALNLETKYLISVSVHYFFINLVNHRASHNTYVAVFCGCVVEYL